PDGGGGVSILSGDGAGFFQRDKDFEVVPGAEGIVVGHFTNSGNDDLAVASFGNDQVPGAVTFIRHDGRFGFTRVDRPNALGRLDLPAGTRPTYLATATIGGLPYLFVADFGNNGILVYQEATPGNFNLKQTLGDVAGPDQMVLGDFMGHGRLDLA